MTVCEIAKLIEPYATLCVRDTDTNEILLSYLVDGESIDTEYSHRAVDKIKILSHCIVLYVKK